MMREHNRGTVDVMIDELPKGILHTRETVIEALLDAQYRLVLIDVHLPAIMMRLAARAEGTR